MSYRENHGFSIFDVDSLEGKQQIYVVIYVVNRMMGPDLR